MSGWLVPINPDKWDSAVSDGKGQIVKLC
jgi:hypothetical protein